MIPKFRAWDKRHNEIVSVHEINFKNDTLTTESIDNGISKDVQMLVFILMQSTGFKDDNGVEIFEGDVVNIHWFYTDYDPETLGAIENEATAEKVVITKEFGNLGFWWNSGDDWVDLTTLALTVQLHEESFELLGNIYENPDLLEVK
ncbi:YopX family protein [Enterococcus faecalis]|uniref:YopX family protein n=1 Tax=Enterococcus faecalis TaxID=1351 RepID=UPI00288D7B48|nr:YopX family protein [Enterococcus faecalis]MDT2026605.1 YopX family protein [Enterococcus faecalis]